MNTKMCPAVYLFGRVHRQEFLPIFRRLLTEYRKSGCSFLLNPDERTERPLPERAVFFQSYPGEFSTQLVQSLGNVPKQFFLGTCCEGMFRTSKITVKELYTNFQYIHNISDEPEITAQHVLVVSAFGPFGNDAARGQFLVDEWSAKGYNTSLMTSVEEPLPVPSPLFVLDADDSPFETVLETVTHLQTKYPGNAFLIYIQSPRIHEKRALTERGVITRAK